MAYIFTDNFDGEAEGTTPPTNWTPTVAGIAEVDDAQYVSSPHSMRLAHSASWRAVAHSETYDDEPFSFYLYNDSINAYYNPRFLDGSGNVHGGLLINATAQGISYYTLAGSTASGVSLSAGWNKFTFTHHSSTKTYDVVKDDTTEICTGASFFNTSESGTATFQAYGKHTTSGYSWYDDFTLGTESPTPFGMTPTTAGVGYGVPIGGGA